MKEKFQDKNINGSIQIKMNDSKGVWIGDKKEIIDNMISIVEEYQEDGYIITLRQLYYQLVARDIIPNHDKVYKKIGAIKDDCVYSGLIDWNAFEDRGRVPIRAYFENSIKSALQRTSRFYALDRQLNQNTHIEVWTEKDAISNILRRVTDPYTMRLVINKGYTSSTAIYAAYERFSDLIKKGKPIRILYFGDHDPSGLDMIRDIKERLIFMFANGERLTHWKFFNTAAQWFIDTHSKYTNANGDSLDIEEAKEGWKVEVLTEYLEYKKLFEVIPVGLTMKQIQLYNPPHNPAKITDPRAKEYIKKFGDISWEVDSLEPKTMIDIVQNAILEHLDIDVYNGVIVKEENDKTKLNKIIDELDVN